MPRLYREMPVNSIWEGSGNVMCLDVVRAARREPDGVGRARRACSPAHAARIAPTTRSSRRCCEELGRTLDDDPARRAAIAPADRDRRCRRRCCCVTRRAGVADAFCATRLAPRILGGGAFGCAAVRGGDSAAIVERALPADPTFASAAILLGGGSAASAFRMARSFALMRRSLSRPIRTSVFWPADRFSSFGSANS